METKITGAKQKVSLRTRSELNDLFIVVTANYRKESVTDEGTDKEKVVGTEYITGQKHVQFSLDQLSDLEKVRLSDLINEAIEDAKSKH